MSYIERSCVIDLSLQSLLQRHSIKETGADISRQRFHSVYENIRLRPSTRRRIDGVFKFIHFGERFRIYTFTVSVYNRLRVDEALGFKETPYNALQRQHKALLSLITPLYLKVML